ncbi:glycosyltransferase [Leptolyngbya sp. GB1-A1]|uniref:glycosyltransferase family 2 protein n=1 Tax=Leptolyngbya sp. GB1-A1 TaxID=2933908 RepID=UPI0032978A54
MLYPIKVVDIELSRPIPTVEGLDGYMGLKGLVRLHGVPIGYVNAPVTLGRCTAETLSKLILEQHSWGIICQLLKNGMSSPQHPEELTLENLIGLPPVEYSGEWPLVTVAVCTRDRPDDMKLCLEALSNLDYPNLDILVIDNAPQTEATQELVKTHYPTVRYVREPRPGLDWARNRAILEAKGEIIAYTDDDVAVDPGWAKALAQVFAENSDVMVVTGLVVPYELEDKSQVLFEHYGGFGRGFECKWYRVDERKSVPIASYYGASGQFGTGANMAYRRCIFDQIGGFDPALDVGTVTNGGGDIEMFFRVLKEGYTLVYEPKAMVRHRHRRDYSKLYAQIANNGIGFYAYFVRSALAYPDERWAYLKLACWWILWWHFGRLYKSFKYANRLPRELIWAEFWGCFVGLTRYQKARRIAQEIAQSFAAEPLLPSQTAKPDRGKPKASTGIAIRTVELTQPLASLTDVKDYPEVWVFATWQGQVLGKVHIQNLYQIVAVSRLRDVIVSHFNLRLLNPEQKINQDTLWAQLTTTLVKHLLPNAKQPEQLAVLPDTTSVSIVIATYDRPNDLRECLQSLLTQHSKRSTEIVVVDNHPESGLTPPVVTEFPGVMLVQEIRKGLSYARNAGIIASTGDIIVMTDDDVVAPPDWIEKLIAAFVHPDVMVATGNVLPFELENPFQQAFEAYGGGLGKGFTSFKVDRNWFESYSRRALPTWDLGATANAAFRSQIFYHPEIGLLSEVLGAGSPTGCCEDTYLFYKVLKAGYTIVYEASAYVKHKHRNTYEALQRQIYSYSKGGPAYHLMTVLEDGDLRGLWRLLVEIPEVYWWRIKGRLQGWDNYPLKLLWQEFLGNLVGAWALWQSYRRVNRLGQSGVYVPVLQRPKTHEDAFSITDQLNQISDSQRNLV